MRPPMRHTHLSIFFVAATILYVPGCEAPSAPVATVAPAPTRQPLGHFTATFDHQAHALSIQRVGSSLPSSSSGSSSPNSVDPIPDPSGVDGDPADGNVDLVSTNCIDGYPASLTFQCDVEVVSGFSRSLPNVVVQIDSAVLNGSSTDAYDGTNSDPSNPLRLPVDHGLWVYTNTTESTADGPFFFTSKADGFNTGTRAWQFSNPDDENVVYDIVVFASESFSSYSRESPSARLSGYADACAGGTSFDGPSKAQIALPFDFTIYNTHTSVLNIGGNGELTFSQTALTDSGTSLALPNTGAPTPAFFAFWDDLGRIALPTQREPVELARICFQTRGSVPNRQFVVEWRDFDFLNAPGGPNLGASLDFEAILFEGTSEIDTVYKTMTGNATSSGRESGAFATVGLQDETGTIATATHGTQDYGTGQSWGYVPAP